MDRIRLAAVAALPLLLAAAAAAPDPLRAVAATPWSWSGAPQQAFANPIVIGAPAAQALVVPIDSIAYRDDSVYLDQQQRMLYLNPGANAMFADDLHMLFPGKLANFTVGIYKPSQTPLSVSTFYFYANDATDSAIGAVLAGPYVINILPGYHAYEVTPPDSVQLTQHVWLAIEFSTQYPGLVVGNDPVVGVSHDIYWDFGHGGTSELGDPPANFLIEVRLTPGPVAVEPVTWTRIKALYATPIRSAASHHGP